MNRSIFTPLVFLCSLTAPLLAAEANPNFLIILTDDQRWDALGVVQQEQGEKARFPWLRTPHLDRLASEGVRFRNAFVVNSLCAPSRASFLTGQYGHHNGILDNGTPLPADRVTYASILRSAGYATAYVGKWHMDKQSGPRPGFDYSASYVGQGKYFDCPFEVNGQPVPSSGYVDDVATDYTIEFLRKNKDRPFVLAMGFKACHSGFAPPPRRERDYEGQVARPVPNLNIQVPYPIAGSPEDKVADWFAEPGSRKLLDYMRCVAGIDDNVGRILDELDQLNLTDKTVVVFAGDNGFYLREHGLADKRTAYEESLRIPLLVRYPRLVGKGSVVDQMVLNIDLAPTLLDLAGVAVPDAMQGRSWRPLLEGRTAPWRQAFYYEYLPERGLGSPHVQAVRTDHAKLITYPGHPEWTEVFDLVADPYETNNVADNPDKAHLRQALADEFERQAAHARGSKPSPTTSAAEP